MSVIKGDIRRALGLFTIKVKDVEIDLSTTKPIEVIDFQNLPLKYLGTDITKIPKEALLKYNTAVRDWFFTYFKSRGVEITDDELKMFIILNQNELYKQFSIGFGLKTEQEYEEGEKQTLEKLKEKN